MPPVTKNEINEIYNKLLPAFAELDAKADMSMPDEKKIETHLLAKKAILWRSKQNTESSKHTVLNFYGGRYKRIVPYYLDLSGTPEAAEKNDKLYEDLKTEDGCKAFANRVAKDLLNIKYEDFFFNGSIHEAVRKYAENSHIFELGFVAADLLTDDHGILDKDIYNAIEDRKELFQNLGIFHEFVATASTNTYLVCDGLSDEKIQLKEQKSGFLEDGFNDFINDSKAARDFDNFCSSYNYCDIFYTKEVREKNIIAQHLADKAELNTYTVMKDENGNRISIHNGINKLYKGEKVTLEYSSPEIRQKIGDVADVSPALNPIQMPQKDEDGKKAVYDAFGKEALTSRGRGLQQEFARLSTVMDGAKLWYTSGSPEFVNISKALKSFSESKTVPNTEQSKAAINDILENCRKYIDGKTGRELKNREQKRLDAVSAVRDSLKAKLNYLNAVSENALIERALSDNEKNQDNILNNEINRLNAYKEETAEFAAENGAVGTLARATVKTIDTLSEYGENALINYDDREFFSKANFRSSLAQMAMLGMVKQERRRQANTGKADEKGRIEKMLDTMFQTDKGRENAIKSISETDTIKNLEKQIINSAEFTKNYFITNGTDKLINDLNSELKSKYPEEKNPGIKDAPVQSKKQEEPQKNNIVC